MRSLNVVLDKPKSIIINENMFAQKYFQMLPLRMDPNYGLYKVQLLKKVNGNFIDVFNDMCINENCLKPSQSPELFSITEIQVRFTFYITLYLLIFSLYKYRCLIYLIYKNSLLIITFSFSSVLC